MATFGGEGQRLGGDAPMDRAALAEARQAALARRQQEMAAADAGHMPGVSAAAPQQGQQGQNPGASAEQRAAALQAAAARQQQRPADQAHRTHLQRPSAPAPMQSVYHLGEVPSLQELALRMVTGQIVREASKGPTNMLAPVGQAVARTILMRMIKDKTLTPRTMPAFNICQLDELILDTYQQTTNDLLYAIRSFRSLRALSIRCCTYVTDTGIGFLTALNTRQFSSLDISNIRLTDRALSSVAQFTALVSLALDGTEITGVGLGYLLPHLKQLRSLGIGNCKALKARDLQALSHVPHLVSLAINGLEIDDLSFLPVLAELQHVNLSSCLNLDPYGLAPLVRATPNLTSIYLTGTHVHDAGLIYLARLTALHTVRLPHKANITDTGLRHLSLLPLTGLDLNDYSNITDKAMQHIVPMANTLLRLSLANTKITDEALSGVRHLRALRELELDRTRITDACLMCLEGLELQVLGLSGTQVTDDGLLRGHIAGPWIQRLSLGNTRVTDEGVLSLRLPNLTHLNLDGTQTTTRLQLPGALPGLPKLTSLRQRVEAR